LAREIRKETKPMVIAANKMDTPRRRRTTRRLPAIPITITPRPRSAHAEKALKSAEQAGVVDYRPGDADFDILGDVSGDQEEGLGADPRLPRGVRRDGGPGGPRDGAVRRTGVTPVSPGGANGLGNERGEVLPDCYLIPPNFDRSGLRA